MHNLHVDTIPMLDCQEQSTDLPTSEKVSEASLMMKETWFTVKKVTYLEAKQSRRVVYKSAHLSINLC